MKKSLLAASAVATIGLTGLTGMAAAQSTASGPDSLVDKIAAKFNLDKAEVQAVFDEEKSARQAERQQMMSDRLQEAVDSGDLTAEQKTLIENKLKEMQTTRQTQQTELQAWADENNLDMRYVMGGGRHGNSNRLETAVENGDITAEQKKLIEDKQAELQDQREAARDALEQWAEDNDIDAQYLFGLSGHGGGERGGMGGRF